MVLVYVNSIFLIRPVLMSRFNWVSIVSCFSLFFFVFLAMIFQDCSLVLLLLYQ
jgi:hypothetical protein